MNHFKAAAAVLAITAANISAAGATSVSAAVLPFSGISLDVGARANGTGLAIEGELDFRGGFFAFGEIVRRTYSDDLQGLNLDNYRAGLGYSLPNSPIYIGASAEQYRRSATGLGSIKINGGGGRVGIRAPIGYSDVVFKAEAGASLFDGDVKTYEGMVGIEAPITKRASLYGAYRFTYVDENDAGHASLDDVRVGIRFEI